MKNVLVTGANGFIGRNLCASLELLEDVTILKYTRENTLADLESYIKKADFIFHTAGVNRPKEVGEFDEVNRGLTETIIKLLEKLDKKTPMLITSSTHATLDNPYGKSKKAAEDLLLNWHKTSGSQVFIFRLTNVFGKWSSPNYNSVVATFCHNIANDEAIQISDPGHRLTLIYIDTVIAKFIDAYLGKITENSNYFYEVEDTHTISLGDLANKIRAFNSSRSTLIMPSLATDFDKYLYATFISYLPEDQLSYPLAIHSDERGWLAEFIKSNQFGQIFISKTKPGIARGNHWHHTKIEKFLVIEGEAIIKFRKLESKKIISYSVTGSELSIVDIPPGYVHSIENTGKSDLITLFWASEILNPEKPDTYYEQV